MIRLYSNDRRSRGKPLCYLKSTRLEYSGEPFVVHVPVLHRIITDRAVRCSPCSYRGYHVDYHRTGGSGSRAHRREGWGTAKPYAIPSSIGGVTEHPRFVSLKLSMCPCHRPAENPAIMPLM